VLQSDEFHITRDQSLQNDDTANIACMENSEDAGIVNVCEVTEAFLRSNMKAFI